MAISEKLVIEARLDLSGVASDVDKLRSQLDNAIGNIKPEINFGIEGAIKQFEDLQSIANSIKLPILGVAGEDASKIAEASLKKLQLEVDALEARKAASAQKDLDRAEQVAAKQEQNSQKLLASLEKQFAASNVRVTQGGNEGADKEAKFTAQTLQEALRYKQQLAAIDKAGFSAADAENAKQLAAGINSLNLQKIEQEFEKVNTGQRNFTGNLRDASELLSIAAQKVKQFQEDASAAFAEQRKSQGALSTQAADAKGLTESLKGLAVELKNQVSTADLTANAAKVAQQGYRETKQNIDVLRATQKLAIAEQIDFGQALGITSTVLKAYNLPASDAAKVTDQLVATARAAKVPVGELGAQYDKLASTASGTGTKFEQLNSFIANASAKGVSAKVSVGALNQALEGLQSGDFVKKAGDLGIVLDEQRIKSGGLEEALKQLKAQGIDQNSSALNTLFGSAKNVSAVLPSLQSGLNTVSDASGIVNKNFETQSGFNRAAASANQLKDALAEVGAAIAPFTLAVTNTLRAASSGFAQLDPSIKTVIGTIAGLVGAGFAVSAVITGTLAVVTPTIGAFKLLAKAIAEKTAADVASVPSAAASTTATAAQGAAATGAAAGLKGFAAAAGSTLVAIAPLAAAVGVLYGAFKVGELIVQERQLREFNETLDVSTKNTQDLGNESFKLASKLQALREARSKGGGDIKKEEGFLNITKQQILELEKQKAIAEQSAAKTLNTDEGRSQKQAFLNTSKDLEIQINSLTNESKKLEEAQKSAFNPKIVGAASEQTKAQTEELKKQAIALKETQNQDSERGIKREFDDAKSKRDRENAQAIAAIEEQNTLKKGELDRRQALETESLKERQALVLQAKQRSFEDAQNERKQAAEQALENRKQAFETRQQSARQQFEDRLNSEKEARAEQQRKADEAFANARADRDKKASEALSGAKQLISDEGAIATANPEDRAKLAAQLAEENRIRTQAAQQGQGGVQSQEQLVAQAKQLAQVSAIATKEEQTKVQLALDELEKANRAKQAELDKAEDAKRQLAKQESDRAFDLAQQEAKRNFDAQQKTEALNFETSVLKPEKQKIESELRAEKLAFETGELAVIKKQQAAEERALQLQQTNEDLVLKKAADAELEALKIKQKDAELAKDRAFEDQKIERERAFKQSQRDLDKASATEIQAILGQTSKQLFDAVAAISNSKISAIAGIGAKNNIVPTTGDKGDPLAQIKAGADAAIASKPITPTAAKPTIPTATPQASAAKSAVQEALRNKIPAFANGGVSKGGLALVGERGREIVNLPKGASVTPANDTRSLLSRGSDNSRVEALLEKLIGSVNRPNLEIKTTDDPATIAADIYRRTAAQDLRRSGL